MDKELQNIIDTFTGADGGVRFVMFKSGYDALKERAESGDKDAVEIVEVVKRFSRLIDILNKRN